MAAIEKIYLNKRDALRFLDYLAGVNGEYKQVFKNSPTIFDYVMTTRESVEGMDEESLAPITRFPQCVDAWLLRRADLPDAVRDYIANHQYGGLTDSDMLTAPIVFESEIPGEKAKKFMVVRRTGVFKKSLAPVTLYDVCISPRYLYHEGIDKWEDSSNTYNAYFVGASDWICSNALVGVRSFKALLRRIRRWNLPAGTVAVVGDFRHEGEMLIKCY